MGANKKESAKRIATEKINLGIEMSEMIKELLSYIDINIFSQIPMFESFINYIVKYTNQNEDKAIQLLEKLNLRIEQILKEVKKCQSN